MISARPEAHDGGHAHGSAAVRIVPGDLATLDRLESDTLVLFSWQDVRPLRGMAGYLDWRLCGALSRALEQGVFTASPGEVVLMPTAGRIGRRRIFWLGLGAYQARATEVPAACRAAIDVLRRARATDAVFVAPRAERGPAAGGASAAPASARADASRESPDRDEAHFVSSLAAALGSERGLARCVLVER